MRFCGHALTLFFPMIVFYFAHVFLYLILNFLRAHVSLAFCNFFQQLREKLKQMSASVLWGLNLNGGQTFPQTLEQRSYENVRQTPPYLLRWRQEHHEALDHWHHQPAQTKRIKSHEVKIKWGKNSHWYENKVVQQKSHNSRRKKSCYNENKLKAIEE